MLLLKLLVVLVVLSRYYGKFSSLKARRWNAFRYIVDILWNSCEITCKYVWACAHTKNRIQWFGHKSKVLSDNKNNSIIIIINE